MTYSFDTAIERRQDPRKRSTACVHLSWDGQRPCRGRATDLSTTGAFVDVGPVRIPEGVIVELAFVLNLNSLIKIYRRSALVVRRSDSGLGLMFLGRRRWVSG